MTSYEKKQIRTMARCMRRRDRFERIASLHSALRTWAYASLVGEMASSDVLNVFRGVVDELEEMDCEQGTQATSTVFSELAGE